MSDATALTTLLRPWIVVHDADAACTITLPAGTRCAPRWLRSSRAWAIDVEGIRHTSSRKPTCDPPVTRRTHATRSGPSGGGNPQIKARLAPDVHAAFCTLAVARGLPPSTLAAQWLTALVTADAKKTTRKKR